MALAAVAMVSIVAIVAFVIDASTFFVIRRELQNAADAAALAGALYISPNTPVPAPGTCNTSDPSPAFPSPPYPAVLRNGPMHPEPVKAACYYADINSAQATRLCNTPAGFKNAYTRGDSHGGPYPVLVVEVSCKAQYSFGRIMNLAPREISAYAIAALGTWDTTSAQFGPWFNCSGLSWCHDASRLFPD
jgi:hypothetical protein